MSSPRMDSAKDGHAELSVRTDVRASDKMTENAGQKM